MKYHYFNHGRQYIGSAAEIVQRMHQTSRAPAKTDQEWVEQVARRALRMPGVVIRTDTFDHFLEDMADNGLVKLTTIHEQGDTQ